MSTVSPVRASNRPTVHTRSVTRAGWGICAAILAVAASLVATWHTPHGTNNRGSLDKQAGQARSVLEVPSVEETRLPLPPLLPSAPGTTSTPSGARRLESTGKFRVRCGETSTCLIDREVCCNTTDGFVCIPRSESCPRGAGRYECDEQADCAHGFSCCKERETAVCREGICSPSQKQLCSDDAECPSGTCYLGVKCRATGRLTLPQGRKPEPQ